MASNKVPPTYNTYSGVHFDLLNPAPDMIFIEDIAHALSLQCRWGGHASRFYSIAEHCLHVSNMVQEAAALHGLLHDAAEAYVGDCITPLKDQVPEYKKIEDRIQQMIFGTFGVGDFSWDRSCVSLADRKMIPTEAKVLLPGSERYEWLKNFPKPYESVEIQCYDPMIVEQLFLNRFHELIAKKPELKTNFKKAS